MELPVYLLLIEQYLRMVKNRCFCSSKFVWQSKWADEMNNLFIFLSEFFRLLIGKKKTFSKFRYLSTAWALNSVITIPSLATISEKCVESHRIKNFTRKNSVALKKSKHDINFCLQASHGCDGRQMASHKHVERTHLC